MCVWVSCILWSAGSCPLQCVRYIPSSLRYFWTHLQPLNLHTLKQTHTDSDTFIQDVTTVFVLVHLNTQTHCTQLWHCDWDEGHGGDKVLSRGLNVEVKSDKKYPTNWHPEDSLPTQEAVETRQGSSVAHRFMLWVRGNNNEKLKVDEEVERGENKIKETERVSKTSRSWRRDHNAENASKNLKGTHEKILRKQRVSRQEKAK